MQKLVAIIDLSGRSNAGIRREGPHKFNSSRLGSRVISGGCSIIRTSAPLIHYPFMTFRIYSFLTPERVGKKLIDDQFLSCLAYTAVFRFPFDAPTVAEDYVFLLERFIIENIIFLTKLLFHDKMLRITFCIGWSSYNLDSTMNSLFDVLTMPCIICLFVSKWRLRPI